MLTYFHVRPYLEVNFEHAQISENAKIAALIVAFFPLTFFDILYDLYFKWMREIFHKKVMT